MNALRFYRLVRPCFYPKYSHLLSSLPCDLRGKHPLSLHRNQQSWAYRPSSTIPDAERIRRPRSLAVEAPNADSVRYETLNNGRIMKFTWANGETAAFHAVWLRHNCQCPNCVTSSNQKAINPSVVNPKMSVTSSSVSGVSKYMNVFIIAITDRVWDTRCTVSPYVSIGDNLFHKSTPIVGFPSSLVDQFTGCDIFHSLLL